MTIHEAQLQNFLPVQSVLYEFHQDTDVPDYWFRVKIHNTQSNNLHYLLCFHAGFDTIQSFVFAPDGEVNSAIIHASVPTEEEPFYIAQESIFPVLLKPGLTTVYCKIVNRTVYSHQLNSIFCNLAEESSFVNYFLKARYYHGIALGMLCIMLVFHIFIFWFFRDRTYLLFVINMFVTIIYLLLRKNYQDEIDWLAPLFPWFRYVHDPAGVLLCLTVILFTQSFLNTEKEDLRMHRIMNYLVVIQATVLLFMFTGQMLYWLNKVSIYQGFITAILVIVASLRSYWRGNKLALYVFFGFLMLVIVPLTYVVPFEQFFDYRYNESDFHYFGEALRSLIFAVGIADRFYGLKKEAVRKEIEKKQLEFEREKHLLDEKERISRDLHDNIGAQLTSLTYGLNRLSKSGKYQPDKMHELYEHANSAILELRETIWVINRNEVTLEEFLDKINNLFWRLRQQDGDIRYELVSDGIPLEKKLNPSQAINLFRIIQEGINNSLKHSKANRITVGLRNGDGVFHLYIRDNGIGFEGKESTLHEHYGLGNMNKRAEEIKSPLRIDSKPGEGTLIAVDFMCNS